MFMILKFFISFLFLMYFAVCDLKKREVENKPIFLFFLTAIAFAIYEGYSLVPDLIYIVVLAIMVLGMYHYGFYGGADCKVFIVMCLLYPIQFILMLVLTFCFAVVYSVAGKLSFLDRFLEMNRGIPLLFCFLIGFCFSFIL